MRSSTAEYLTFITATGKSDVNAIYADENVWLSQKMMGLLYNVEPNTITYHLQKAFKSMELNEDSVARIFRVTASDGKEYNAETEFGKYRIKQDRLFKSDFDKFLIIDEGDDKNE